MYCQLLILTVVPQQDGTGPSSDRSSPISSALAPLRVCVCVCVCVHMRTHAQSCQTLCDPMDYSPPGSSVRKIFQARIMEWLPFPAPGDLLDSGIKLESLKSPALAGRFFTSAPPGKPTPLRSTWIIVFDANFLNGFAVAKHPLPNGRG